MVRLEVHYRPGRLVRGSELGSGRTGRQHFVPTSRQQRHTMLSSKSACMFLFLRRSRNQTNAKMASSPTTPPTTPPAIAPVSVPSAQGSVAKISLTTSATAAGASGRNRVDTGRCDNLTIRASDCGGTARQRLSHERQKMTHKKVVDTGCPALLRLLAELAIAALLLASTAELCPGATLLLPTPTPPPLLPADDDAAGLEVAWALDEDG